MEEARSILSHVESLHKDANHNCWAYLLGPKPEIFYSSDDGEPAGTAGKPILAALKRSDLFNVMMVVTRYFGGVKLGVRGLIEAYGQATDLSLQCSERILRIPKKSLVISLPYAIIGEITRLLSGGVVDAPVWSYGAEVQVSLSVKVSAAPEIAAALEEFQARKLIYSWNWVVQK